MVSASSHIGTNPCAQRPPDQAANSSSPNPAGPGKSELPTRQSPCAFKKPRCCTEPPQTRINWATQHRQKSRNFFVKQAQLTHKRHLAQLAGQQNKHHITAGETCWIPPELKAAISHLAGRFLILPSPNPWCIPDNFWANCRVLSAPIRHSTPPL